MLLISSIPIFGLCDPTFTRVDAEFAIRLARGKANLAWYSGITWSRILNPNSNSFTMNKKIVEDTIRLDYIYPNSNLEEGIPEKKWYNFLPENIQKVLKSIRNIIFNQNKKIDNKYHPDQIDWENVFKLRHEELENVNKNETGKFMFKENKK